MIVFGVGKSVSVNQEGGQVRFRGANATLHVSVAYFPVQFLSLPGMCTILFPSKPYLERSVQLAMLIAYLRALYSSCVVNHCTIVASVNSTIQP